MKKFEADKNLQNKFECVIWLISLPQSLLTFLAFSKFQTKRLAMKLKYSLQIYFEKIILPNIITHPCLVGQLNLLLNAAIWRKRAVILNFFPKKSVISKTFWRKFANVEIAAKTDPFSYFCNRKKLKIIKKKKQRKL